VAREAVIALLAGRVSSERVVAGRAEFGEFVAARTLVAGRTLVALSCTEEGVLRRTTAAAGCLLRQGLKLARLARYRCEVLSVRGTVVAHRAVDAESCAVARELAIIAGLALYLAPNVRSRIKSREATFEELADAFSLVAPLV